MKAKTSTALLFTVLLLHSFVHLSTAASGRKLLEADEEMLVVARRINAENMKDYVPVEANPKHDPDQRDPDLNPPPRDPHDSNPPPEADPPHNNDPPHETDPPRDRSGIYHHVHHQRQGHQSPAVQIQTPVNIPAPAPTTINDGV